MLGIMRAGRHGTYFDQWKVPIEGVFPLSQAAEMHRRLEGRHVAGKLLLQAGRPS